MNWKYIIAGICIPINIIFIIVGIFISDALAVILGLVSIMLVLIPIINKNYENQKKQIQEEKKDC